MPSRPGRRVDLHHQRAVVALEHVDAGDPQPHDLGRAHRGPLVLRVERRPPRPSRRGARSSGTRRPARSGASPRRRGRRRRARGCRGPCSRRRTRWISTFCLVLCSVSMIASATLRSGARITPMPWVPSSSLITTGAPPTRSIAGSTSARLRTNVVAGMPMSWRDRIWVARSLSRAVGDAVRGVGRVDVHLLELAHHRGAEVGDRVADARQDRVVVATAACRGTAGRARARTGRSRSAAC